MRVRDLITASPKRRPGGRSGLTSWEEKNGSTRKTRTGGQTPHQKQIHVQMEQYLVHLPSPSHIAKEARENPHHKTRTDTPPTPTILRRPPKPAPTHTHTSRTKQTFINRQLTNSQHPSVHNKPQTKPQHKNTRQLALNYETKTRKRPTVSGTRKLNGTT